MKIAHIVHSLNIGGLEKMVLDQVLLSPSKDIEYSVICLDAKGSFAEDLEGKGYGVICFNRKGFDPSLFFKLAEYLRKEKIDIVHTHNPGPLFYGSIAAKLAKIPVTVHTKHGTNFRKSKKDNWINRKMIKVPTRIVAVSDDAYRIAIEHDKVPEKKLSMVRNGINVKEFRDRRTDRNKLLEKYRLPPEGLLIGIVARLSWEKDIQTLVESFALLAGNKRNVNLGIVGDGEERAKLESIAGERGISDKVFFLGFQRNIAEILSIFDIFVLSSIREGTSVTLIEAMASGLPVVVTDVGGNGELIKDGVNGFVVPVRGINEMKQALLRLIENRQMAQDMGKRNSEVSAQKYDIQDTIAAYEALYRVQLTQKCPEKKQ